MRAKILNASAGSGKTYQLAYKYVHDVIERPESYSAILAVTFTNKATEEMKTRILKEINTLASGQRSGYMSLLRRETGLDEAEIRRRARTARTRILHNYSRFTVLTIDRFFQRILRAFIKELGIDLNYNIELETASVLTKSADALVEQITSDPELQRWLTDFVQERIDDGAKWDIRDGILALGDELFKERNRDALAAAGDKETLVRLVNEATTRSAASKRHFQAIGKQAVERMNQTGVTPESFKGGRNSFAQIFRKVAAGEIVPPTKTVRTCSLSTDGWCTKTASPAVVAAAALLQPLLAELCAFYDEHVRLWNTAELLRENYRSFALLTDLYARGATIVSSEKGYGIYFRREDTLYFVELMADDDRSAEVLMEAAREKEVIVERAVITVGAAQNLFLGEGTRQDYGMIRFDAEPFDVEESYMRLMMES